MKKIYVFLLLFFIAFTNSFAKNDSPIFVLNSFHPELRWTMYQVTGIRNALLHAHYSGNLYIEYLDTKNFNYSEMAPMYYELFKRKYKGFDFKVILCTDNDALRFLQKYGNELFPEASYVFSGINNISDSSSIDKKKITGVFCNMAFDENIETIIKILPETKEIVSFFDSTDFGQYIFDEYKESIKKFKNKNIKFTNIFNPTINELLSKLSKLKKGQVIFQGELGKDRNGIVNNPSNITALIKKITKVPLFGSEIDMFPKGVIGGKLVNPYFEGRIAGFLALRILNGENPKDIKIIKSSTAKFIYDYNGLKKNGINQSLLPKTATIVNIPISYWKRNEDLLIKVSIGFIVLLILIFILSLNVIARKKAEKQLLRSKGEIDKILSSIAECIWSVDLDSSNKVLNNYFSPVIEKIYGYSLELFTSNIKKWEDFVYFEDKHLVENAYYNLINNISNNELLVFRIVSGDGTIKWIEQNITITKTDLGGFRFDGITKDITKTREQEEISLRYLKAIEQSPISIIITNTGGLIEYVNPYFEKSSGYNFEEIKNTNPRFLKTDYYKKEKLY